MRSLKERKIIEDKLWRTLILKRMKEGSGTGKGVRKDKTLEEEIRRRTEVVEDGVLAWKPNFLEVAESRDGAA